MIGLWRQPFPGWLKFIDFYSRNHQLIACKQGDGKCWQFYPFGKSFPLSWYFLMIELPFRGHSTFVVSHSFLTAYNGVEPPGGQTNTTKSTEVEIGIKTIRIARLVYFILIYCIFASVCACGFVSECVNYLLHSKYIYDSTDQIN